MKLAIISTLILFPALTPQMASAYDMDCAVILCLAGGFPGAECLPPFQYMMARLTRIPPLPPFGPCTFEGPTGAIDTLPLDGPEYAWLSQMRVMWWNSERRTQHDEGLVYSWALRSCTASNDCKSMGRAMMSHRPPPETAQSENEQSLTLPRTGRFIGVEYSTWHGEMRFSGWSRY